MAVSPKQVRLDLGLTQEQMAEVIGYHPRSIQKIENSERSLTERTKRLFELVELVPKDKLKKLVGN